MILVSTGTNGKAFVRLLEAVASLDTAEPLVVQHGPGSAPKPDATCVAYLGFADYAGLVGASRVVVTHGGVGSVLVALIKGKRPIVMPRLARLGEAVDDHQLSFARRLAAAGLVTLAEDEHQLHLAIAAADPELPVPLQERDGSLVADLREFLSTAEPRRRRRRDPVRVRQAPIDDLHA